MVKNANLGVSVMAALLKRLLCQKSLPMAAIHPGLSDRAAKCSLGNKSQFKLTCQRKYAKLCKARLDSRHPFKEQNACPAPCADAKPAQRNHRELPRLDAGCFRFLHPRLCAQG